MSISLFIAADVVPQNRTESLFKQKNLDMFKEIKPFVCDDLNVVNLEAPIVDGNPPPIKKQGPSLRAPAETLDVLKEVGFNVVTLANNHFRDYGQTGVKKTIEQACLLGMKTVGGGRDVSEAQKYLTFNKDGKSVAIINACENEFSIAFEKEGGSNPIDLICMQKIILEAKKECDYVVLILHGGVEMYNLPTPRMQKWYRHFVELGADAVVNHHQHCMSGLEIYNGKPIFYGLGNFCFDRGFGGKIEEWHKGFAVKLYLDEKVSFALIPYVQCAEKPVVKIRNEREFQNDIKVLNSIIVDEEQLLSSWKSYVDRKQKETLGFLLPNGVMRSLFYRGFLGKLYSKKKCVEIKNKLFCESHLELLKTTFKELTNA